jgi:hypothetical protein
LKKFGHEKVRLVAEVANVKDKHAVAVYKDTAKIGYLPRDYAFKDDIWTAITKKQLVTVVARAADDIKPATQMMMSFAQQDKGVEKDKGLPLEPLYGAVKSVQDYKESQAEQADSDKTQEYKFSYNITKLKYLKPNPAKGPYPDNWYGYITLYGTFNTVPGDYTHRTSIVDGAGEDGIQVSLFNNKGKLTATKAKPSDHDYANKAVISPQYEEFLTMVTVIVNLIDLVNKPKSKKGLFTNYTGDIRCASKDGKLVSKIVRN